MGVAFDFVSKHLPTLTEPLWGFSMNRVDIWESSRFSDSSGAPSPIDHTKMQREREMLIIWVGFPPSKMHLPELTELSNPTTFLFRCPERYVSFCSHWHPLLGCHIVYSSCKNATSVVTENETIREEERGTWSAKMGTEQLEWHQHSTMSALQRKCTKVSSLFFRRDEVLKTQTAISTKKPHMICSVTGSLSNPNSVNCTSYFLFFVLKIRQGWSLLLNLVLFYHDRNRKLGSVSAVSCHVHWLSSTEKKSLSEGNDCVMCSGTASSLLDIGILELKRSNCTERSSKWAVSPGWKTVWAQLFISGLSAHLSSPGFVLCSYISGKIHEKPWLKLILNRKDRESKAANFCLLPAPFLQKGKACVSFPKCHLSFFWGVIASA